MSEPLTATVPQAAPDVPAPPKTIGRFTVQNEIGRGSYGVVYAAHDPVLGREVAIKIIPLASEERYRTQIEASFLREAKSAGGMSHPSIVTIYDAGKTDALAYIAMERLHGQDLHEYLASGNRMSPRQAAAMMMRVADAIHYANKRGLVHRDIKPSNIFLSRDLKPKLLDFGTALAPVSEPAQRGSRQLVGTPNYMSPEQAKGESLDARSDIFSLGTILYELLAGRRAFDGRTVDETLDRVLGAAPKPVEKIRPDTPPALAQIVHKAMAREPGDRYQKASELRNALAEFVDGSRPASADASAAKPPTLQAAPPSSRVPLLFAAALLALLAIGGGSMLMNRNAPAPVELQAAPVPIIPPMAPPPAPESAAAAPAPSEAEAPKAEQKAAPRKRTETAAAPNGDATVQIAVAPWGEVLVDGAVQGVSPPLTQVTLAPGLHTVEIRNGSSPPFVARVELKAGEKIQLQHRFQP
ncbi:MAG TPA: serine/threonine-protein kinase [Burkholderiaceae bacterium]|nr:serine/threonine-protein kinase [Burkholderiaceae bacterium]